MLVLAAVGALATVLTNCTVEIQRVDDSDDPVSPADLASREQARKDLDETLHGGPSPRP